MANDPTADDDLLAELTEVIGIFDPVPESLRRFAIGSQRLISFEAELAEIVADSLVDATAGTRSTGGLRTLAYQWSGARMRLELDRTSGVAEITPTASLVLLVTPLVTSELAINESGLLRFDLPGETFQLRATVGADTIATPWITH